MTFSTDAVSNSEGCVRERGVVKYKSSLRSKFTIRKFNE